MRHFVILLILLKTLTLSANSSLSLNSPNGKLYADVDLNNNSLSITLFSNKDKLIEVKTLQFEFAGNSCLNILKEKKHSFNNIRNSWKPLYGENDIVKDYYNSLNLVVTSEANEKKVTVDIRLYDEGLAFRYGFDEVDFWNKTLLKENTEFLFDSNYSTWVTGKAQGLYKEAKISDIKECVDRPQVIEISDNKYIAIGEAALVDFSRMKLSRNEKSLGLISVLSGKVELDLARYKSPWRYIMVGNSAGELVQNNYFVLNLNEPNQIDDCSWIKPGLVMRENTLTTVGAKKSIDFASENNISYIEFDAGWYGNEYDNESDATTVTPDPKRYKGDLNMQEVIDYANKKGIGIILYVNIRALKRQLDEILPLYKEWGIKGVKFGFVDVGDQYSTSWLHHAVRKAAKYKLMVDIHDEYRPTGYSRTYPNLITQEGIRGDEESPSLQQTIYTYFNRMICGAGDYTNCYKADRIYTKMGGLSGQLAKRIAIYSPWQFVFWYDNPDMLKRNRILDFYCSIPCVWDETRFIEGEMGEYLVVARRSGNEWYISVLNAGYDRKVNINLSSLVDVKHYKAELYYQSSDKNNKDVSIKNYKTLDDTLSFNILKNSGCVLYLSK